MNDEKIRRNPNFKWTKQKGDAALALAEGKTNVKVAQEIGVDESTIRLWLKDPDFGAEVDRLTLMTDIATRAERLRIAKRVVAEKIKDDKANSDKDLLDWLKYAQGETDGIKLDLAALLEAQTSLADTGQNRTGEKGNISSIESKRGKSKSA